MDKVLEFEELFIKHPFELQSLSKEHLVSVKISISISI